MSHVAQQGDRFRLLSALAGRPTPVSLNISGESVPARTLLKAMKANPDAFNAWIQAKGIDDRTFDAALKQGTLAIAPRPLPPMPAVDAAFLADPAALLRALGGDSAAPAPGELEGAARIATLLAAMPKDQRTRYLGAARTLGVSRMDASIALGERYAANDPSALLFQAELIKFRHGRVQLAGLLASSKRPIELSDLHGNQTDPAAIAQTARLCAISLRFLHDGRWYLLTGGTQPSTLAAAEAERAPKGTVRISITEAFKPGRYGDEVFARLGIDRGRAALLLSSLNSAYVYGGGGEQSTLTVDMSPGSELFETFALNDAAAPAPLYVGLARLLDTVKTPEATALAQSLREGKNPHESDLLLRQRAVALLPGGATPPLATAWAIDWATAPATPHLPQPSSQVFVTAAEQFSWYSPSGFTTVRHWNKGLSAHMSPAALFKSVFDIRHFNEKARDQFSTTAGDERPFLDPKLRPEQVHFIALHQDDPGFIKSSEDIARAFSERGKIPKTTTLLVQEAKPAVEAMLAKVRAAKRGDVLLIAYNGHGSDSSFGPFFASHVDQVRAEAERRGVHVAWWMNSCYSSGFNWSAQRERYKRMKAIRSLPDDVHAMFELIERARGSEGYGQLFVADNKQHKASYPKLLRSNGTGGDAEYLDMLQEAFDAELDRYEPRQ